MTRRAFKGMRELAAVLAMTLVIQVGIGHADWVDRSSELPGMSTGTVAVVSSAIVGGLVGLWLWKRSREQALEATEVKFDRYVVGVTAQKDVLLQNEKDHAVGIRAVRFEGDAALRLVEPVSPTVLQPNAELRIPVEFSPRAAGDYRANLIVETDEGDVRVKLEGSAVPRQARGIETPLDERMDFAIRSLGERLATWSVTTD